MHSRVPEGHNRKTLSTQARNATSPYMNRPPRVREPFDTQRLKMSEHHQTFTQSTLSEGMQHMQIGYPYSHSAFTNDQQLATDHANLPPMPLHAGIAIYQGPFTTLSDLA